VWYVSKPADARTRFFLASSLERAGDDAKALAAARFVEEALAR